MQDLGQSELLGMFRKMVLIRRFDAMAGGGAGGGGLWDPRSKATTTGADSALQSPQGRWKFGLQTRASGLYWA